MSSGDFVACMIPQMDFFKKKPVQACVTSRNVQKLKPLSALPESPDVIEFLCPGRPLNFLDINNIVLRVVVSMRKNDGAALVAADNHLFICDAPLHSMFSQCEIFLSEQPVTKSPHLYHYKSILDLNASSSLDGRRGMLSSMLYMPDAFGLEDDAATWRERQRPFLLSQRVELLGKLRADVCQMEDGLYILDNVPLRVRLTLNPNSVYMWTDDAAHTGKMVFHDAELHVPYYVGNPEHSLGLEQALSAQPATYRFKQTQLKTFLHPAQSPNLHIPIAFSGKLPTSIVLTAVAATNYNGSWATNPYEFPHCGFQELSFSANGVERRYVMDPDTPYGCTSVLRSMYTELGMDCEEVCGSAYTMSSIRTGKFACAVDLTVDHTGSGPSQNVAEYGTVSIQGRLKNALNYAVCIILYAKYDGVMEINSSREVTVL